MSVAEVANTSRQYFGIALAAMVADQATKYAIARSLDLGQSVTLTPFFNIVHVLNPGAAFSFLADAGGWQRWFFIVLGTAIAIGLSLLLYRGVADRREALGYSLLMGGALGNVMDRIWGGAVVDFLDMHVAGWHWPAFNVADIAINAGVGALLWASLRPAPVLANSPQ